MQPQITDAVNILSSGGLVAFPTETVYGLGADANNEQAIRKVFAVKKRPLNHPLIVHIGTITELANWAIEIPKIAELLAANFWPGPLTLILTKHPKVSKLITGGQDTIAIRIPRHPLTLAMLQQFNSGIVGPSANSYGSISPTTAQHVQQDLGKQVDYILDGGPCEIGIESTIVDVTTNYPQILRQGMLSPQELDKVLSSQHQQIITNKPSNIRVPGSSISHYAPQKPLYLIASKDFLITASKAIKQQLNFCYLSFQPCPINNNQIIWLKANNQPQLYAKNLYAYLHQLDATNTDGIMVEMPANTLKWDAIIDRLTRASSTDNLPLK